MANDLIALAQRVEAGSGSDRELDGSVAVSLRRTIGDEPPSHYTGSLDAVLALAEEMLPGWGWSSANNQEDGWLAWGWEKMPAHFFAEPGHADVHGKHKTECRARLAAILRAKTREA